ncbi:MAG: PH domain-containing protein [Patescibacteria group bacterium]
MPHLIETGVNSGDPAFLYLNLHPGEEIKLIVRHHFAGFLATLAIGLAMALFPILLVAAAGLALGEGFNDWQKLVVLMISGYYLFLLTFLFGAFINFYFDIIFITNERIINVNQQGLLARQVSELSMNQIQNVTAEVNGLLRSLFNFGTLAIETAGEGTSDDPSRPGLQGYFTISDLPDPNRLARIILELHRKNDPNGSP